jgi:hypothetical protein
MLSAEDLSHCSEINRDKEMLKIMKDIIEAYCDKKQIEKETKRYIREALEYHR